MCHCRRQLSTNVRPEPLKVPFPQADVFERIVDLLVTLAEPESYLTNDAITMNYEFKPRQADYYASAGRYLGLMERRRDSNEGTIYVLTPFGKKTMAKDARSRNLALVEVILSRGVFRRAMESYCKTGELPPVSVVIGWMKDANIEINRITANRRAQTVIGWVRWIAKLTKDA